MPQITACPDLPRYQQLASGQMDEADRDSLLEHLERCNPCAQKLNTLAEPDTLVEMIRKAEMQGVVAAEGIVARLVERLSKLRPDETHSVVEQATLPPREPAALPSLTFACPACGKTLKVKGEQAGKKGKCPHCQEAVRVSAGAGGPSLAEARTMAPVNPAARGAATAALPAADLPAKEHYDFLSPPQAPDELGRLGPYRVLQVLGAGGMGVVFRAEDPQLQRLVALKAMLPGLAASDSAKQRFLREARAAAAIKHDHIVTIYQVGEDRGAPFLAMEFLEGEPLDNRLQREGKLAMPEVLRIGREMALGLAAAHKRELIHRDIKPANIWLETHGQPGASATGGRVKILDFGLARAVGQENQLTQQGAIIGTPGYMAPEQAQGKSLDARADLFSLGCVLYRLATGETPFRGTDMISTLMAVATENPRPPHEMDPGVPQPLSELILRLLAKSPEDRPESANVVAEALQGIEKQTSMSTAQAEPKPTKAKRGSTTRMAAGRAQRSRPPQRRIPLPWLVGLAGGVLAAVIAGIMVFWPTSRGVVKIESDDPSVEMVFDKTGPTIKGADKQPITLRAGDHGVLIKRGEFEFEADKFVLKKGTTITLRVELLKGKIQVSADGRVIGAKDLPAVVATGASPGGSPPKTFTNSLGMEFALVPKGKAWLGGGYGKVGTDEVNIAHDFYLGVYEVTQAQWQRFMGKNPSVFTRERVGKEIGDDELKRFPVENVSWEEAQAFITLVNEKVKKHAMEAGWEYRLPTELQWEYACRGGPMTDKAQSAFDFYFEKPSNTLAKDQATFDGTGLKRPSKVGSYPPNRLGLYDMHGNVWEWCADHIDDPKRGPIRVDRGGGWFDSAWGCRPTERRPLYTPSDRRDNIGFRLARVPVGKEIMKIAAEEKKSAVAAKVPPAFKNTLGMEFVLVPKGKSWLGGGAGKPGDKEVEILHDFYMGKYEVSQEEWEKVTGFNPSAITAVAGVSKEDQKRFPVEMVSWDDAQAFIERLNKKEKEAGWAYRLPKEAEWEYACRGGPMADRFDSAFDFYLDKATNTLLPDQANFEHGKALKRTCKVGSYQPNRLGLYDMHGNVWEWCDDVEKASDGASLRVGRGGGWGDVAGGCRAARRGADPPSNRYLYFGLRLARVPVDKEGTTK